MNAEEAIIRAERAQAILNDPLVVETFAALEAEIIRQWRENDPAKPSTPEQRDALWLTLQILDRFRTEFRRYISGGHMAVDALKAREAARKAETAET